ncbi:MAG: TonB-dependent receptor [Ferruginibacter sp.]
MNLYQESYAFNEAGMRKKNYNHHHAPITFRSLFMRLLLLSFLLTINFLLFAGKTVSQDLDKMLMSIDLKEMSLKQVFAKIEKQTDFKFTYISSDIKQFKSLTYHKQNISLAKLLNELLANTGLTYEQLGQNILIRQQQGNVLKITEERNIVEGIIRGNVTDDKGKSINGASVLIKGTQNGTTTDEQGNFVLRNVPEGKVVLVVTAIGYAENEITTSISAAQQNLSLNVQLKPVQQSLGEVVVVAYGAQAKRNITGSIQTVNAKELQDLPVGQFTQKLQGKLAGVQINQTTGAPGAGLQVRIRGAASISTSASPLYVIDGFPITGDISNINPDEIETVTILKDAASTSLYGSRAAFGVVLITTKSSKAGQTNIGVSAYTGSQTVPQKGRPEMMNGTEWAQFKKEYYEDQGVAVPAAFQNPSLYGAGTNWYDAMLRSAPISNYSLSLSTNKEKLSSAVTAGYFTQKGVLLNSDYKRFSLRANSIFKVSDAIRVGLNLAPSYTINNAPGTDGIFFGGGGLINNALLTPPVLNYKNTDGTLPMTVTTPGITTFPTPNWVRSIQDIKNNTSTSRLLSNAYLEYEPLKKLIVKTSINVDFGQALYNSFQPSTASRSFASTPSALSANLFQSNNRYYSWLSETTAGYSKQINDHGFDLLAGYTVQKARSDYSNISGSNFPDDRVQTIGAATVKNAPFMDMQEWSLISYLARINYNYQNKYLLSGSIRRDGSSRFGTNNKWGNFPSVSAGWIISEESFAKNIKALSFLKLRGSYGVTGNNNIGNYTQYATVSSGVNSAFGNTTATGIAVTNLANNNLGWENTKQLDIGIDVGLIDNRISLTYDYYDKQTSNLLFGLSVPRESGFSTFTGNVGKIKFWGHELGLNTNNLIGDFKWNTNFNIAFSDNKVLALSGLSDKLYVGVGAARTITKVGGRIGQFWGMVQDGVYDDQKEFDNSPKSINSMVGTIKFKDLNGDGVVKFGDEEGDRTIIGNPFPKFIYGMTNSFSYKNVDLSIVVSGSYGNDIARMMDQGTTNLDGVFNVLKDVKDRWRSPSNPGAGKYGKTTGSTGDERDQFHTRFVQNGSYLTIKNIALGYNLPVKRFKAFSNIRLYASMQQAAVFTKYGGVNPEISTDNNGNTASSLSQGLDFAAYPVPRTITFGVNVNLK